MANQKIPNLIVENAHIIFRNFAGNEDHYNAKGNRNFCLLLDPESAEGMKAQGWNVKFLKPRDETEAPHPYVKVNVAYRNSPPNIYMIDALTGNKTRVSEENVNQLDTADIQKLDIEVNPWEYEAGKVSGYLKTMYATIRSDPFAAKYANPNEEGDIPWN